MGQEATVLPPDAYTSQEVFDWEIRHFFEEGWVFLGHGQEMSTPGDQRAFTIGSESVLLLRDREGHLNGVYNTCRHRGHELLEPGSARNLGAIKCPYHAWVYGLDGALRAAPLFGEVEGFDRSEYSLVPVELQDWGGFLFVNSSGDAPPFRNLLQDLGELVAPEAVEAWSIVETTEYEVDANWKTVAVDHLLSNHTHEEKAGETHHYGVFPGQLLGLHPDYMATYRVEPLGPGRTRVERRLLAPAEEREASAQVAGIRDDPQKFLAAIARGYLAEGRLPEGGALD